MKSMKSIGYLLLYLIEIFIFNIRLLTVIRFWFRYRSRFIMLASFLFPN